MNKTSLPEYVGRMIAAAEKALAFTDKMSADQFLLDLRTQMATTMALMLLGEAVSRISTIYPDFIAAHPEIPWIKIKGMRNMIAHDYNELEMQVVWRAVRSELPSLISQLRALRHPHAQGE